MHAHAEFLMRCLIPGGHETSPDNKTVNKKEEQNNMKQCYPAALSQHEPT